MRHSEQNIFLALPLIEKSSGPVGSNRTFGDFCKRMSLEQSIGLSKSVYCDSRFGLTFFIPFTPTSPYYGVISAHPTECGLTFQTLDELTDPVVFRNYANRGVDVVRRQAEDRSDLQAITVTQHVRYDGLGAGPNSRSFTSTHLHIEGHPEILDAGYVPYRGKLEALGIHRELHDPTTVIAKSVLHAEFPELSLNESSGAFIRKYNSGDDYSHINETTFDYIAKLSCRWKHWFQMISKCFKSDEMHFHDEAQMLSNIHDLQQEHPAIFNRQSSRMLNWIALGSGQANCNTIFNRTINGSITVFIDVVNRTQEIRFAPRTYMAPEIQLPGLDGLHNIVLKDRTSRPLVGVEQEGRLQNYRNIIAQY